MSLDSLIEKGVVVTIDQEYIRITPLIVREIPGFTEQIGPIIGLLKAENIDYIGLITNHYLNVVIAVSIAARHDIEWVESLGVDDLVKLIMAIMEVNFDFLANQILPAFFRSLRGLDKKLGGLNLTLPLGKQD